MSLGGMNVQNRGPGSRISSAFIGFAAIGPPVFVRMRNGKVAALGNRQRRKRNLLGTGNGHAPSEFIERGLRRAFVKHVQRMGTGSDVLDLKRAVFLRRIEIGRPQHDDYSAHSRVDVTKHAHYAGPGESHTPRTSGRIQTQVEELSVVIREGVVKDGVEIREI